MKYKKEKKNNNKIISLSNHIVSADTVNTFKHRLDKFWLNQEVIYNYKADLVGTGNRSIIN